VGQHTAVFAPVGYLKQICWNDPIYLKCGSEHGPDLRLSSAGRGLHVLDRLGHESLQVQSAIESLQLLTEPFRNESHRRVVEAVRLASIFEMEKK
jgi:hypothetical protein